MANYKSSFDKVILAEGGYVNDPDDSGGETYLGITRVHHPKAKMWATIDDIKKQYGVSGITARLKKIDSITEEARQIYKTQYWDKLKLDKVKSQGIAHQLFDHAVNAGVSASIKIAQELTGLTKTGVLTDSLIDRLNKWGK